jgi:voltage-gated potassium channel
MNLKQIVEDTDTRAGRIFDWVIQCLIIASLVTFSIETLPNLSASTQELLKSFEIVVVLIFSVEYLLRIWVADRKLLALYVRQLALGGF